MIRYILFFFFFIIINLSAFSQLTSLEEELISPSRSMSSDLDYLLKMNLSGLGSTEKELPFWLQHNQRGRVNKNTNFTALLTGKKAFFLTENAFVLSGASVLYQDGNNPFLVPEELFLHFQNSSVALTLGTKQKEDLYNGLSSTNENILWSLNARPLPGFAVRTVKPIFLFSDKGLGFEILWGEYLMGRNRHVKNAKLHHKSFHLVFENKSELQIKVGLQHFAIWGGVSPKFGPQPQTFQDYLKILLGQGGGEGATLGDQQNVLGNHLGSYEFQVTKKFKNFELSTFYNSLFEDGSGRVLRNTPDGRYGVYFENNSKERLINSLIYEFYYTRHQGHIDDSSIDRRDNYFNHRGHYDSGWTYQNVVLGAPFFTKSPDGNGISNNTFYAHHFGIGGEFFNVFHNYPYKLLLSYARNEGTHIERYVKKQDVFYLLYEMQVFDGIFGMSFQFGADYNSWNSPNYGLGVSINYRIL